MASISKKVVVVGDAGCGKSSLLTVYLTDKVLDSNNPHRVENEVTNVVVDGQEVELSLFNTSGEKLGKLVMFKGDPCRK